MKKLAVILVTVVLLLFSVQALAGMANPVAQPNSKAFGNSLEGWIEAYFRTSFENAAIPKKHVAFLPTVGEDGAQTGNVFDVEVKPGTALVLPISVYIGFPEDTPLSPNAFTGAVTLDGQAIAEPNHDYYFGPTEFEPPIVVDFGDFGVFTLAFYQGLGVVIKPLTPGVHTIELYSSIDAPEGFSEYSNTWNITVAP